jgi:hypothetical protein
MSSESFSQLVDLTRYVILKAPDRFPVDTNMNLGKAFEELRRGLHDSRAEVGQHFDEIARLLAEALDAYRRTDIRSGIKRLQEVDLILRRT